MTIEHSIVLGIVQGLTEFIPVSSSGHLALIPEILGWKAQSTAFDAMLHGGTLLALLISLRKRILAITTESIKENRFLTLFTKVSIATVPTGLIAYIFQDKFDELSSGLVISFMLISIGVLMILSDKFFTRKENTKKLKDERLAERKVLDIPVVKYLLIGGSQVLALVRGSSRSGTTILTGRALNLSLNEATELSFLLGIPITFLAFSYSIYELIREGISSDELSIMAAGFIASFISGIIAINFMFKFIERLGLKWFGFYRIILGIVALIVFAL